MLPERYRDAEWRNTAASICPARGRIGIGFQLASGEAVRLALDADSARHLVETLNDAICGEAAIPRDRKG